MRTIATIGLIGVLVFVGNEMLKGWRCVNILQHYYHTTGEVNARFAEQATRYQCWSDSRR